MNRLRIVLLERVLQASVDEHAYNKRTFTNLDTKAQNTTAIAGVFLAAALAFLRGQALEQFVQFSGRYVVVFLGVSIILLLGSVLSCLIAMRIRGVIAPIGSVELIEMVNDILSLEPSEFTDATHENFLRDQIAAWQTTLRDTSNRSKARAVLIGQLLLATAIVVVAILLLVILISVWCSATP
jgi:uncharacterized membrane protein YgdD (TMEM256/DUF423 family)